MGLPPSSAVGASTAGAAGTLSTLRGATRGLLVVAETCSAAEAVAAAAVARTLGWPVVADVLSGGAMSWRKGRCCLSLNLQGAKSGALN